MTLFIKQFNSYTLYYYGTLMVMVFDNGKFSITRTNQCPGFLTADEEDAVNRKMWERP